jgi:hypothetical protein
MSTVQLLPGRLWAYATQLHSFPGLEIPGAMKYPRLLFQ